MKKQFKSFIMGVIISSLFFSSVAIYASGGIESTVNVILNKVNVSLDGDIIGKQNEGYTLASGDVVPFSILYKGTTYLPIRKVGESLGLIIGWDGVSETATLSSSSELIEDVSRVKIVMQNGESMIFELYPKYAPETVANFLGLVESGFYDGLKFHRIIEGFMAQSGDPLGNGTGGSSKRIIGEFSNNGFDQNTLKHSKGVISMARSSNPDSASSQFFIMDGDAPNLDGNYAAFGMLVEGEDVLDIIMATEVEKSLQGEMSSPLTNVIIKSMTIE